MCPICLTSSALIASGLGSVGGIVTIAAVVMRGGSHAKPGGLPHHSQEKAQ